MTRETVGYRRLYDAMGCSLGQGDELRLQSPVGPAISGEVYLGPKPRFGISVMTGEGFIIPTEPGLLIKVEHHADASKSSYPRRFFTEICCSLEVDVPDELSTAFREKDPKNSKAHDAVLDLAEARGKDLMSAADLVAGAVGLRLHRQFVIKVICENFFALKPGDDVTRFATPWAEVLEEIALNEVGRQNLARLLEACGAADPALQTLAASVFHWLLRAWTERDPISRFVALFVPLEMILEGYTRVPAPEWPALREIVSAHGGDQQKTLLPFLDRLRSTDRPSLNERFEAVARDSGHASWERDVKAFRTFYRLRNALLHRGEPSVRFHITVGEDEASEMGDLVERYVSLKLFGDMQVYRSRFRVD